MKTKKNRYGIVLSVTVLLFFMGVAKLFTISQAQLERPKALSGSSVSQEDADLGLQEKKKIALTFDDGPDSEYTPMLLDGLAERNGIVKDSVILLEQVRTIDKSRLREKVCHLDEDAIGKIDSALAVSLALST